MSKPRPIDGKFRITHMDQWDQEFVDAEIPGFLLFDSPKHGEFHFGHVSGTMDCEHTKRGGRPAVEWTFDGYDETNPICGRGWAVLEKGHTLVGQLFIHQGDSSGFTAEKDEGVRAKPGTSRKQTKMLPVVNADTGEEMIVDLDRIKPGRVRQTSLPDPLLDRIRAIHRALRGVYDLPLERMELNFMRDLHPEREVLVWERIVKTLADVRSALPKAEPKLILRTLLGQSMGALSAAERADPVVRKILRLAGGRSPQ